MKVLTVFQSLGPIDARNIRRDSMLQWMVLIPILSAVIVRWGVPWLTNAMIARYGFDLTPYNPVIMAYFFVLMTPIIFGVLIGFLLLDERDDGTLAALQVTPLPMNTYIAYRVLTPTILSIILMLIVYPITRMGILNFGELLIAAIVAAPLAPLFALAFASIAQNKVQGFAVMKASGIVLMPPIFVFFIETQWEPLIFGIFPTYWPMKIYYLLEAGNTQIWVYVIFGLVYLCTLTYFLVRRFNKIMHQ